MNSQPHLKPVSVCEVYDNEYEYNESITTSARHCCRYFCAFELIIIA